MFHVIIISFDFVNLIFLGDVKLHTDTQSRPQLGGSDIKDCPETVPPCRLADTVTSMMASGLRKALALPLTRVTSG
jgi:hypothetical protein